MRERKTGEERGREMNIAEEREEKRGIERDLWSKSEKRERNRDGG